MNIQGEDYVKLHFNCRDPDDYTTDPIIGNDALLAKCGVKMCVVSSADLIDDIILRLFRVQEAVETSLWENEELYECTFFLSPQDEEHEEVDTGMEVTDWKVRRVADNDYVLYEETYLAGEGEVLSTGHCVRADCLTMMAAVQQKRNEGWKIYGSCNTRESVFLGKVVAEFPDYLLQ